MYQSKHLKRIFPTGELGYVSVTADGVIFAGCRGVLVVLFQSEYFPPRFQHLPKLAPGGYRFESSGEITPCDIQPVAGILDAGRIDNPILKITNVIRSNFADRATGNRYRILEAPDGNHIYVSDRDLDAVYSLADGVTQLRLSSAGNLVRLYGHGGGCRGAVPTVEGPK